MRAGLQLGGAGGLAGEELQPGLHGQVFALPEAAQRGQVVGAGHGQGLGGPGGGRRKALGSRVALEEQRAVGQQRTRLHGAAHGGRHVAEVFADDHAAVAHALQRQDAQQGVERVGGIGSRPATHVVRRQPEQAHQAHHMVQPQGAGVPHVGAQGVDERREAQGPQTQRIERRQAPVLAQRVERVGRRAHIHAQRIGAALAPGVGAAFVHAHGQVAVEPQAHAQRLGMGLGGLQLRLGQPLQPAVVLQLHGMVLGELLHGGGCGVAPGLGPRRPAPHGGVCGHEVGLQRLEQCMQAQAFTPALHKAVELRCAGRALGQVLLREVLPQQGQRRVFGGGHTSVVHHLGAAQRGQAALEGGTLHTLAHGRGLGVFGHVFDGDVERVQRLAAAGAVGAGHLGALGKQGVQRVQAHEVGSQAGHHLDQRTQVAEVTHAPVARRAQGVELHAGAPPAPTAIRQRVGHPAARGGDHHGAVVGGLGG